MRRGPPIAIVVAPLPRRGKPERVEHVEQVAEIERGRAPLAPCHELLHRARVAVHVTEDGGDLCGLCVGWSAEREGDSDVFPCSHG